MGGVPLLLWISSSKNRFQQGTPPFSIPVRTPDLVIPPPAHNDGTTSDHNAHYLYADNTRQHFYAHFTPLNILSVEMLSRYLAT